MSQQEPQRLICLTRDGRPLYAAPAAAPGQPQPIAVFADGSPVWPSPPGTVPPGEAMPFGLLASGEPLWIAEPGDNNGLNAKKAFYKRKRLLIPGGLAVIVVVVGALASPSATVAGSPSPTKNTSVDQSPAAPSAAGNQAAASAGAAAGASAAAAVIAADAAVKACNAQVAAWYVEAHAQDGANGGGFDDAVPNYTPMLQQASSSDPAFPAWLAGAAAVGHLSYGTSSFDSINQQFAAAAAAVCEKQAG